MRCSRCDTLNTEGAHYCVACGLDLSHQVYEYAPPAPNTAAPSGPPQGLPPAIYPYSGLAGHSVLQALRPSREASKLFWAGLTLLGLGFVWGPCLGFFGLVASLGSQVDDPGAVQITWLGIASCIFALFFLPGLAFTFTGRPRRHR